MAVYQTVDVVTKETNEQNNESMFLRKNCRVKNIELSIKPSSCGHTEISTDVASPTTRERLSRASIKKISDLAFYFRYQKKKIQKLSEKTEQASQRNSKNTMTSRESTNSMDAFLARADLNEMAHFLSFCGKVTHEKLQAGTTGTPKRKCTDRQTIEHLSSEGSDRKPTRSNSKESIESADTGYESVGRVSKDQKQNASEGANQPLHKRQRTDPLPSDDNRPRKGTAVVAALQPKRGRDSHECTLSKQYLDSFSERNGKTVIMQKFMADQQKATQLESPRQKLYVGGLELSENDERKSKRIKESYLLNDVNVRSIQNINVDVQTHSMHSGPRTLRRESGFANLRKCSESSRFQLPAHAHITQEALFKYSFDGSFPNPDTYQSAEFTYSFTETDNSLIIEDIVEKHVTTAEKSLSIDSTSEEEFNNLLEMNIYSVDESDYLNDSRV
ncbi:hypothetical protein DPMN_104664 [Dreissena polymorpha]|uniref:Uncharacterized protein n=1 Tax=Dreissena polymorpha TaxID=45954 RepID=A0A9D4K2U4_DREPO|nr:hypothetical protein DPMN_104664 [Dreissena polymorpha]